MTDEQDESPEPIEKRVERCRQVAGALLAYTIRIPDRIGLFVTVVVHEREGDAHALVSACMTSQELARLSTVLGEASSGAAELALEVADRSPWGPDPEGGTPPPDPAG